MAGLLDYLQQEQAPGLLGGSGLSQMLMATGAGLLGGQGFGGAIGAGMAAQQAARKDALQNLLLRHNLAKDERDFNLRREQFDFTKQNAGTTDDIKEFNFAKSQGFAGTLEQWMQRKRAGAGEYALTPQWGRDKDGNPVMLQLGKGGEAVASKLPEGVSLAGKEPIKMDAGTHFVLMDPITRQTIGIVQKDVAGKERAEEIGRAQGQATVALPSTLAGAEQALDVIGKIREHPGKAYGTGVLGGLPAIPGTEQAGFVSLVDQLKGRTFLEAFNQLKGGGAITEIEGKKAEDAIARLNRVQNTKDFDAALGDLEKVVRDGMVRARIKAGQAQPMSDATVALPAPAPAANGVAAPRIGAVVNGYRYKGGNPNDRNSWEAAR